MKIHRLLGILACLLRRGKVTTPYLAEKFEVSRRTISRDIDTLCQAGIPLVTEQGRGGGVSLPPGYVLDRQLFTQKELQTLLSGLQGIGSIFSPTHMAALEEKLAMLSDADPSLSIDLASHYRTSLTGKIALLRQAIEERRLLSFYYYSPQGEALRQVEPYRITFRWNDWYLIAWCTAREDFRLFKLSRLWELSLTDIAFSPRRLPAEIMDAEAVWKENYRLEALFDQAVKYRLVEEYGPACFTVRPDGLLAFSCRFTFYGQMRSWVLSFGDAVTVLAPQELREDLGRQGEKIFRRYLKQDR